MKRIIITENQKKVLVNHLINENHSNKLTGMDELYHPKNFASLKTFCDNKFEKLSSGSGRLVYIIDETTVLKLAKNKKGLAQNEQETNAYYNNVFGTDFAKIHDYFETEEGVWWLVAEKANKLTAAKFKEITGFPVKLMFEVIRADVDMAKTYNSSPIRGISEDVLEAIREDPFYQMIRELCIDLSYSIGDLVRMNSYGWVVKEDGTEEIVIVDYGLSDDVYDEHYGLRESITTINDDTISDETDVEYVNKQEKSAILKNCVLEICEKLGLQNMPKITLINSPSYTKQNKSFASYSPSTEEISCSIYGRNTADILRSLAHELVHHKQKIENRLYSGSGEDGTDIENEANSEAGRLMRGFGREVDNIFDENLITEGNKILNKRNFIQKTRCQK